jgi:aminopeptidase N
MPVAEITRAETGERARLVRVGSYAIALDLTRGAEVFGSTSVIRFSCTQPGAATYLDLIADKVHEISLNGTPVDPGAAYSDGRIRLSGLADSNELRVVADCRYSSDGTGLHRSVDSADGKVYTYTKFEPAYARRVFANFDQPDLKSSFSFTVTVPAHWTVLSNQPGSPPGPDDQASAGQNSASEGSAVWRFAPTPPISTYLTAVAAGEYHVVRSEHTTARGQVIPLAIACRASLADYLQADDLFQITRAGLDYYTGLFRGDYPFAKYDQVFAPEYSAGATENVGCVILSDEFLFRSRTTDTMYEVRAMVQLHEMAHMWFGNLVTMRWWDDLWLNESFAEFCGSLSSAEATRFTDAWTSFSCARKTWGYMQDQLPSTHPIAADVPTLSQAVANFDGISYAKGASVLRQLAARVGREQFLAGIRAYFSQHAWGNATLADLLAAIEASSGARLADWSKAWLETAGPNTLRADFELDDSGAFRSFAVLQEAPAEHPTLRPHHIAIGLYQLTDSSLRRTRRIEVSVQGPRTEVAGLAGVPQPDLTLLNDGDLDYAIVRFDQRSLRTLAASIGTLDDSLARAVCWGAAIDMLRQAELSLPAFARMLAAGMAAESSISLLQILHATTHRAITQSGDPDWVPEGKRELADAAVRLLRAAEPGSDHQLAWAQMLCWTATAPEQLDLLTGLLDGSTELPGLPVDTELRWSVLRRLATMGRAGDADIDAELARDGTDAGRRYALTCRASIPDAEHKAAAWRLLAESSELGTQGILQVAGGFIQPEHAALLEPYAERYFELLPQIWASRGEHVRVRLGQVLFPYPAVSPELLGRIDALLETDAGREPGLARLLVEQRDIAARALRSRALPATVG